MYARILRKWSLAKFLMYLWLPVVILMLVFCCQDASSMHLSIATNSMTLRPGSTHLLYDDSPTNRHRSRRRIKRNHRRSNINPNISEQQNNMKLNRTISNNFSHYPYNYSKTMLNNLATPASNIASKIFANVAPATTALLPNVPSPNSKIIEESSYKLNINNNYNNDNNKEYTSFTSSANLNLFNKFSNNNENNLINSNKSKRNAITPSTFHQNQYNLQQRLQPFSSSDWQMRLESSSSTKSHERYERVVNIPIENYANDNRDQMNSNDRNYNENPEWLTQQREKRARIEAHRKRYRRLQQLQAFQMLSADNQTKQNEENRNSEKLVPPTIISSGKLTSNENYINELMIGRNRRDSSLLPLRSNDNNNNNNNNNHRDRHRRQRQRRYCSARDPTQLAFQAPTVLEGKVRSMSSDRRVNFSVTFGVKEIFKSQSGFKLPDLLRLQFTYRNSSECDIYREHLQSRGYVTLRDDIEQGRVYLLFVEQLSLGNFTVLGQPIRKTRKAVNKVRLGVSVNYAQPASIKSLTASKTTMQIGDELRIVCKVQGQPPPKVTWFKNNRSINRNRALYHFVHLKKRSELIVKSYNVSDAGNYECRAKNKVAQRPDRRFIRIDTSQKSIRRNEESSSHLSGAKCPENWQTYCLNGATCRYFMDVTEVACVCPDGFIGDRCQTKEPTNLEPNPTYKSGYIADDPNAAFDASGELDDEDENDDNSSAEKLLMLAKKRHEFYKKNK